MGNLLFRHVKHALSIVMQNLVADETTVAPYGMNISTNGDGMHHTSHITANLDKALMLHEGV